MEFFIFILPYRIFQVKYCNRVLKKYFFEISQKRLKFFNKKKINQNHGVLSTRKPYRVSIEKIIFYEILIILSKCLSARYSMLSNFVYAIAQKLV